ncbi:MAG TPA: DUF5990 family protein [Acidimicrobiales bacterium]|nr:DUF5990 family protein [Acidimicrobiales bacterium]
MQVRIEAVDLPGRACAPHDTTARYDNVHVAVQRGREPFQPVPGDAPAATWDLDVPTRPGPDGTIDIGGPFAQGRRGDRFLYLTWGTVGGAGEFAMFRRAKLHLADVDPAALARAAAGEGPLVARLGLTDGGGLPLCARVRPPVVTWTCG